MHKRKSKTLWTRSCLKASTVLLLSVQGRCYSVQKWLLEWLQGLAPGGRTVVWRVTPLAFLGAHVSSGTLLPPSLLNVSFYSKAARKANKQIKPSRDIKVTMLCKKKAAILPFLHQIRGAATSSPPPSPCYSPGWHGGQELPGSRTTGFLYLTPALIPHPSLNSSLRQNCLWTRVTQPIAMQVRKSLCNFKL